MPDGEKSASEQLAEIQLRRIRQRAQNQNGASMAALGCIGIVLVFVVIGAILAAITPNAKPGAQPVTRALIAAKKMGGGQNYKATANESAAATIAGLDTDSRRFYHLGLQHVYHQHQKIGSFTIGQIINGEIGRENQQELARRAQAAALAQAARSHAAAIAAEERHYIRGTPDCLILDDRTVHTASEGYGWSIVGKVMNRCGRDFRYVQVEISFLDASGNLENSGLANVNNLGAGETWAFTKRVYESISQGGKWRIEKVGGY